MKVAEVKWNEVKKRIYKKASVLETTIEQDKV